jgi:hypothetical protein
MKKKHFITTLSILISFNLSFAQNGKRISVLFLGNSYTSVNNLPLLVQNIAKANGDTLDFDVNAPGGQTFKQHTENATSLSKINSKQWDFVILQAQSQEPSFPPQQVATQTTPYALRLDSLIHANYLCTKTVFYETWGRKNGDPNNCQYYSPLCTYNGMQDRLQSSYKLFADSCKAIVAPAGEAWRSSITSNPTLNLYQSDESHPSIEGSYLTACVIYEVLFGKTAVNNTYTASISNANVLFLQTTAHNTLTNNLNYSNIGKFNPCNTSDLNENESLLNFGIYPNPTRDFLTVNLPKNFNNIASSYSITDMAGKVILADKQIPSTIDISTLQSGIYLITFQYNNQLSSLRFVKN